MDTEKDISEIIGSLLKDPKISDIVSSLQGSVPKDEGKSAADDEKEDKRDGDGGFTLSPEMLSALPQVMQMLSSSGIGDSLFKKPTDKKMTVSNGEGDRKALLMALRPYLSEKRCAVVDSLLQIEGLRLLLGSAGNMK